MESGDTVRRARRVRIDGCAVPGECWLTFCALMFAPLRSAILATRLFPFWQATMRSVLPNWSRASTGTPPSSIASSSATWPWRACLNSSSARCCAASRSRPAAEAEGAGAGGGAGILALTSPIAAPAAAVSSTARAVCGASGSSRGVTKLLDSSLRAVLSTPSRGVTKEVRVRLSIWPPRAAASIAPRARLAAKPPAVPGRFAFCHDG
jgi:hypothetical protein